MFTQGLLYLDLPANSWSLLETTRNPEPNTCQRALCSQVSGQLGQAAQVHMPGAWSHTASEQSVRQKEEAAFALLDRVSLPIHLLLQSDINSGMRKQSLKRYPWRRGCDSETDRASCNLASCFLQMRPGAIVIKVLCRLEVGAFMWNHWYFLSSWNTLVLFPLVYLLI